MISKQFTLGAIGRLTSRLMLFAGFSTLASFASTTASAAALSDLVVTSISMTPSNPQPGQPVVFSAMVKNQGSGATPDWVTTGVLFLVDGQAVSWAASYNASIPAGQSVFLTADWGPYYTNSFNLPAGTHTITAVVDDVNRINESDETNNSYSAPVSVGNPLPDLIITSAGISPSSPRPGDRVVFSVTVKNQGSLATPNGVTNGVLFSVDGQSVSWSAGNASSIAAGQSVVLTADGGPTGVNYYSAVGGTHAFTAVVDDVNRINESNESNNSFSSSFQVGNSLPDLIVTNVSMSPASPQAGDHIVFSATVKNQGGGPTPAGTTNGVAFSVDGNVVAWSAGNSSSIAAGQSVVLTADGGPAGSNYYLAAAGSHAFVANVDDVNRINESNETNNTLSTSFSVAAAASSGSSDPAAISGQNYKMTFDEEFTSLGTISSGSVYNGAKWYNGTEQCCMADSTGLPAVMYPSSVNGQSVNPYTLINGGGLNITLQKVNNAWYSGILTSVDGAGQGFSQKYGYFEIIAQLPGDKGTWPSFWLLSESNLTSRQNIGEIDVFESYGTWTTGFCTTVHDWSGGTTPLGTCDIPVSSVSDGYHKYGMLWTESTTTIYFDDRPVLQTATPTVMKQPYYMLLDMGLGGGDGDTSQTPSQSAFKIKSVKVWAPN